MKPKHALKPIFLLVILLVCLPLFTRYCLADPSASSVGTAYVFPSGLPTIDEYFVLGAVLAGAIVFVVALCFYMLRREPI